MPRDPLSLFLGLFLAGGALLPQAVQDASWSELAQPPDTDGWTELLERDARLRFTSRSESQALGILERSTIPTSVRAAALMALGCSGSIRQRPRLESWAHEGSMLERRAAVLALGELRGGSEPLLRELASGSDKELGQCAVLALLRSGRQAPLAFVDGIAQADDHPLSEDASRLMVFREFPSASEPQPSSTLLLNLRWEAARRFGLVDNTPWSTLVLARLAADDEYLDEVVLRAASVIRKSGVRDHLMIELVEGRRPARLRAGVHALPAEMGDLIRHGLWKPAGVEEWRVILDEIDDHGIEVFCTDLLAHALAEPQVEWIAAGLLARAGDWSFLEQLSFDPADATVLERIEACEVYGSGRDPSFIARIEPMRQDDNPRVRAAALVAQARLGQREALEELRITFLTEDHPERENRIEMTTRTGRDGATLDLLDEFLPHVEGARRLRLAAFMAVAGRPSARWALREEIEGLPLEEAFSEEVVRALARGATSKDLELLAEGFPHPESDVLNIELGLALVRGGHPASLPLLRAALWKEPTDRRSFSRSALAGLLIVRSGGMHTLIDESQRPPAGASSRDLRRVGFAIGEWGGLEVLEDLARDLRAGSGDPVMQGAPGAAPFSGSSAGSPPVRRAP